MRPINPHIKGYVVEVSVKRFSPHWGILCEAKIDKHKYKIYDGYCCIASQNIWRISIWLTTAKELGLFAYQYRNLI